MRKFIDLIESILAESVNIHIDNPGGDWLKYQQEDAEERMAKARWKTGISGSVTASCPRHLMLPVALLKKIPGARDEQRQPGEPQYDSLMEIVKENGFDNRDSPVLVMVNHFGDAFLWEGNTRVAVAHDLGIEKIYAEVRWWNGGEAVPGVMSPDVVKRFGEIG